MVERIAVVLNRAVLLYDESNNDNWSSGSVNEAAVVVMVDNLSTSTQQYCHSLRCIVHCIVVQWQNQ